MNKRERQIERPGERSKQESKENENRVKETAETSPDASLHTHCQGPLLMQTQGRGKTPQTVKNKETLADNFNHLAAHK